MKQAQNWPPDTRGTALFLVGMFVGALIEAAIWVAYRTLAR